MGSIGVFSFVAIDAGIDAGMDAGVEIPPWTVGVAVPASGGELNAGVTGRETLTALVRWDSSDFCVTPDEDSGVGRPGVVCPGGEAMEVTAAGVLFTVFAGLFRFFFNAAGTTWFGILIFGTRRPLAGSAGALKFIALRAPFLFFACTSSGDTADIAPTEERNEM